MSFGNYSSTAVLLDIGEDVNVSHRINRFLDMSNTWLTTLAPSDELDDLNISTKNSATEFYAAYLFGLSTGQFSDALSEITKEYKNIGVGIVEQALRSEAVVFKIKKINP